MTQLSRERKRRRVSRHVRIPEKFILDLSRNKERSATKMAVEKRGKRIGSLTVREATTPTGLTFDTGKVTMEIFLSAFSYLLAK